MKFLFCFLLLVAPLRAAVIVTNAPSADTYFEAYGSESKNFGAAPELRLDQWHGRQVFLRFPLTGLAAGQHVSRATLRLFIKDLGFNEAGECPDLKTCVGLFDVVTPWTESGLTLRSPDSQRTWSQGPGLPGGKYGDVGPVPQPDIGVNLRRPEIALDPIQVKKDSWLELEVTDFIRAQLHAGQTEVNLLLRGSTLSRNYTFPSREAKETGQRPELRLEFAEGPAQQPTLLDVPQPAPHPRLYVTAQSLPRLRQQMAGGLRLSTAWSNWVEVGRAGLAQGKFHDMGPHEGCENTALAWLITRDRRFLADSVAYAQIVLSKRMSAHFGDVHEATFTGASWVHAIACHYDWCFDELSPAQREEAAGWLKEAARWIWARSSAPVAHNDGGARQCALGSAALALLGDDPEAADLYRRSRENFERNLLPWLNDGGRGGRSGDGGEYEGLHAFYIVKFAWMSHTATGRDVFTESPFFFNRLKHVLFGWYPRRLVAPNGGYSMRQYYSPSGDHIRMGYVGDTQPYQSAAALCARFQDTPEAQGVRWLAGEWPSPWMQYTLRWAVLGEWETLPARPPQELAYLDEGCNTLFMRSDWSDDATWILFENAPLVSAHGSLDSGTFEIFKGDILAARTGNLDHANVGAAHTMNYLHRTIASNGLLIHDPKEKWKGFLGGAGGINDGGGERTNWPLTTSPEAETYSNYRHVFQRGQITRFKHTDAFTYALADLTPAYTSPHFHNASLNEPKVTSVTRQVLYLRGLDSLVVFDRVRSTQPEFKKTWLLHSLGGLDVLDGAETKIGAGEFHYTGATRAVIHHGWPKPIPSFARCLSVTLLPEKARLTRIGGRVELPPGERSSWPGDQWHGQHGHQHLKDFWVNGTNYPPGNPPETRWFGEPTSASFIAGTPDESGGRGKWRLEVSPPAPSLEDVFFHVLCPRLGREGVFPEVTRLPDAGPFAGALVVQGKEGTAVFIPRTEAAQSGGALELPKDSLLTVLVTGLAPGGYTITGAKPANVPVGGDGVLQLAEASGTVSFEAASKAGEAHVLSSPDGRIQVAIQMPRTTSLEKPRWSASFRGQPILTGCSLGLETTESGDLLAGARVVGQRSRSVDERLPVPFGKSDHANDRFRETRFMVESSKQRRVEIVFRCYNDAIALRYELAAGDPSASVTITNETTSFALAGEPAAFVQYLEHDKTSHEHQVVPTPYREIRPGVLLDLPLTFAWEKTNTYVAITEAALRRYAGMSLLRLPGQNDPQELVCQLTPRPDGTKVKGPLPLKTPWRVVLIGDHPGALLESGTIYCLNDPTVIPDTSWIKPGKITFHWWNGDVYDGRPGPPILSFEMAKRYIDFCARSGIPIHSLTSTENTTTPWYQQSKPGVDPGPDTDVTRPRAGFDLAAIRRYAESKGVRLWTWVHQGALRGRVEEAFAAFEKLGWSGMMVDFFDHDDQDNIEFVESILEAAARHRILIHLHGVWKPTGLERTYPNLMNHEGALNLEYLKWSDRCSPEHNLMMAFTRLIAGPMDYHLGGFRAVPRAQFQPLHVAPNVLGTRCHMLAMYVCFDNPTPMVADYPTAYEEQPGFDFLVEVPTWWDETKVLAGEVGELLVTARRKGGTWYLGGMSAKRSRELELPLSFLSAGRYSAKIWKDAADAEADPNRITLETLNLTPADSIEVKLARDGGFVAKLVPLL